jgi:predicted RNA-binding Zn ribbon-like protein
MDQIGMTVENKDKKFYFLGGRLCLDFVNTVGCRGIETLNEYLQSYSDLVEWGRQAGLLTEQEARGLLRKAVERQEDANDVLRRAIGLRETLYRIFSATVYGNSPNKVDLTMLSKELSNAMKRSQIVLESGGLSWKLFGDENALDRVLWEVVRSAADLLTSKELDRTRWCADESCGLVFVDLSKNRSRRWCDMKDCGNQAKARRHYERVKSSGK